MPFYITQDEHNEMLKMAEVVVRVNPYAHRTPQEIVSYMISQADHLDDGYTATGGWMVTVYKDAEGRKRIKASIHSCLYDDILRWHKVPD